MDPISIGFGLFTAILAVYSVYESRSAKKAVSDTIVGKNSHEDLQKLKELLRILENAKDAASVWIEGVPDSLQSGRSYENDQMLLLVSIDALRTKAPLDLGNEFDGLVEKSSEYLQATHSAIVNPEINENRWKGALSELQFLIRRFQQIERKLIDDQVQGVAT